MEGNFGLFERIRIKRNIQKNLNISTKELTDAELFFINEKSELINETNLKKALELYRTIGYKNTSIALENDLINLNAIDIMNNIIDKFPKDFEVLYNDFFKLNFPAFNSENNNLINMYKENGKITFEQYIDNKTTTSQNLPDFFFTPFVKEILKVYKKNENISNYSYSLKEIENNRPINFGDYVKLLKLGLDFEKIPFNIIITMNNKIIDEKCVDQAVEIYNFLEKEQLWEEIKYFIDFSINPYESLLNYIKEEDSISFDKKEKIYEFIQKKCNLYTQYDLLTSLNGKYVLKNNSEILTDDDIYKIINKETLDTLNINVNKIRILSNYFSLYKLETILTNCYKFRSTSFYNDFDNNIDIVSLINAEPMDLEKIQSWFSQDLWKYIKNYINPVDTTNFNGMEILNINYQNFSAAYNKTYLDWNLDSSFWGFNFPLKFSLTHSEQIYQKLPEVKKLFLNVLTLLKNKNIVITNPFEEQSNYKVPVEFMQAFTSILIAFDYFGLHKSQEAIENNIINSDIDSSIIKWFDENVKAVKGIYTHSSDIPQFIEIFSNVTDKHNQNFLQELLNKFSEVKEIRQDAIRETIANPSILKISDLFDVYPNCTFSLLPLKSTFKKNLISQEDFSKLQDSFLIALQQKNSLLPHFNLETDNSVFDMYKIWEPDLTVINIENKYQDIGIDNLCEVISSNNKRIIEITNKQNSSKSYAIITRTEENEIHIDIKPINYITEEDIKKLLETLEKNLDKTDYINKIYINEMLVKDYHTNIQTKFEYTECASLDSTFVRGKDRELKKAYNILSKAFGELGVGTFASQAPYMLIGRDWVLQYYSNKDKVLTLDVVGRWNEQPNNKLGSEEMKNEILKLGKEHNKVCCAPHATSYYMLAKWAKDGKILIEIDEQFKTYNEESLASSTSISTGGRYTSQEGPTPNFSRNVMVRRLRPSGKFDILVNNQGIVHNVIFKVVDNSLTLEEFEILERQKEVYEDVVKYLDEKNREQKVTLGLK